MYVWNKCFRSELICCCSKGVVYRARNAATGQLVALKKSRASLSLERTALRYEARVLMYVAGHPSIPAVYAYGRFPHFEYLAIELLGRDLRDVVEEKGQLPLDDVLKIADQLVGSHIKCLVHSGSDWCRVPDILFGAHTWAVHSPS